MRRPIRTTALLLTAVLSFGPTAALADDTTRVRHIYVDDSRDLRNSYFMAMLTLALDNTRDSHGDYTLSAAPTPMPQSRALSELAAGRSLDVVWTMTSREREAALLPVRIPLLRGLGGYRLLLIRQDDAPRFAEITDVAGLRAMQAGQGHDWPDTDILAANGIPVQRVAGYEPLFMMLQQRRFDFLPRMLNEPWQEVAQRPDMGLMVEPELLLYYPTASYFFVGPDNTALADRLRQGLERALEDGSFETLFREHPINRQALNQARLGQRRVLVLDNPLLPPETPLDDARLWFDMARDLPPAP
ncbi:MAG: transporter substrate-binding domain-containing protein [Alcanivorax sp.]|nr:transporter substrate-binding domain-containing protein [Alcanivorax sp.]